MQYSEEQRLMQEYLEENPCFNGEGYDTSLIEKAIKYQVANLECEMGG